MYMSQTFVNSEPQETKVLDEVASLPEDNFVLLKFVCRFFYDVTSNVARTKTTVAELADLFGPIFCRPQVSFSISMSVMKECCFF